MMMMNFISHDHVAVGGKGNLIVYFFTDCARFYQRGDNIFNKQTNLFVSKISLVCTSLLILIFCSLLVQGIKM